MATVRQSIVSAYPYAVIVNQNNTGKTSVVQGAIVQQTVAQPAGTTKTSTQLMMGV